MRRLAALFLLIALVLTGCSGSSGTAAGSGGSTSTPSTGTASGGTPGSASDCPTENTRSFAKTRFVADVGGTAFLVRRYIYQPYQQGSFRKGASGRRVALLKAAAASATSVKLLKNASENAKANPTLCRTLSAPLANLTGTLSSLAGSLGTGTFSPGLVGGLGGAVTGLLDSSKKAGIPVQEQPTSLR